MHVRMPLLMINKNAAVFFGSTLICISAFLINYTALPNKESLTISVMRVVNIVTEENTWKRVTFMSNDGMILECRGKNNWPLLGPSSCPVEKLETIINQNVAVSHDGSKIYEIKVNNEAVLQYDDFIWKRNFGVLMAFVIFIASLYIFKRGGLFNRS